MHNLQKGLYQDSGVSSACLWPNGVAPICLPLWRPVIYGFYSVIPLPWCQAIVCQAACSQRLLGLAKDVSCCRCYRIESILCLLV